MACVHVIKFLFGITRMAYLEFISICVYFIKQPMAFLKKKKKKKFIPLVQFKPKEKKNTKNIQIWDPPSGRSGVCFDSILSHPNSSLARNCPLWE